MENWAICTNLILATFLVAALLALYCVSLRSAESIRLTRSLLAEVVHGTYLHSVVNDVYIGQCRDAGGMWTISPAHAHLDGTLDICILAMPDDRAELEWVLAHQYAHVIAHKSFISTGHDRTWSQMLMALGYPEEASCFRGHICGTPSHVAHEARGTPFSRLATAIDTEVAQRTVRPARWNPLPRLTRSLGAFANL